MKYPLDKRWRLIIGFALFGLLITGVSVGSALLGLDDLKLVVILVILCPPSLIAIPLSYIMTNNVGLIAICLCIAIANAAPYGVVGAAFAGQRKPD